MDLFRSQPPTNANKFDVSTLKYIIQVTQILTSYTINNSITNFYILHVLVEIIYNRFYVIIKDV